MVIAGLVIALGEVVDDAIIDVENIVRRLRLNRSRDKPAVGVPRSCSTPRWRSAAPVVYASLIVMLVFLPIFFLDGLAGSFFRPLALAYVLAILASLFVALTVTPALSYMLLTGDTASGPRGAAGALAQAAVYGRSCRAFVARPVAGAVVLLVAAFALTGVAVTRLGAGVPARLSGDRLPDALRREAGHVARGDATRSRRGPARSCGRSPACSNFGSHIGRAEVADEVVGPNFTELWISIDPDVDYQATVKQDRRRPSTAIPACTATC